MDCGIIYIKIIPKSPKAEWVQYCHIFDSLPDFLQLDFMSVISRINEEYKDKMIVSMKYDVHPGCIVLSEHVDEIAKRIYEKFDELMDEVLGENCVRCAYSVGEVENPKDEVSINESWGNGLVRLGRFMDNNNEIGIFRI